MTKPFRIGVGAAALGLVGLMVYSTMQLSEHKVEVCVNFEGRSHCASAAAPTLEEATRTAQATACSLVTRNREENMVCLGRPPATVRPLTGN